MKENVERGIRLKAVLIYLVFVLVCGVMILFVLGMRNNIEEQKEYVRQYNHILTLTNELVFTVNEAQSEATLYISGKRRTNFKKFQEKITDVEAIIDSLSMISSESFNDSLLTRTSILLKEKGKIISELNKQFRKQVSADTIMNQFSRTHSSLDGDSVLFKTIVKDTIINKPANKNFWGRLANVFSPAKSADTLVSVYTHVTDTLRLSEEDKKEILSGVSGLAEQISSDYANRLNTIEKQAGRLIRTDQEINMQLSVLLGSLSRKAMDATFNELLLSEQMIRKNYNFSIYGGIFAFVLILLLIVLIINDVNKGQATRRALQQVLDMRRQLLLSVSHDIKSPLNSILGIVDGWRCKQIIPEKEAQVLENSGNYILALLNNLLEFSNIEQGELSVSNNKFNIQSFSSDIVAMFEPLASRKKLTLEYDLDIDGPAIVSGDEIKMKQIIINVLSNAIKYTTKGKVHFSVEYRNKSLLFRITDTGVGISQKDINELFKPFRRIEKNNSLAHGSGLGMYVVKELVTLLKGDIVVRSIEGKGTTVDVVLPVYKALDSGIIAPHKILILDDDESVLFILREMFSAAGCEVEINSSPIEFGKQIDPFVYDLIITDMEMDPISGIDVLKVSKNLSPETPVVIMTGRGDYNSDKAKQDGFDFYLPKPVSRSMVSHLLGIEGDILSQPTTLDELYGDDKEVLREVLEVLISSTRDHIDNLQLAVDSDDFEKAQAVSHKMLSVFMQLGASDCLDTLRWMDTLRDSKGEDYPEWKNRIIVVISQAEKQYEMLITMKC